MNTSWDQYVESYRIVECDRCLGRLDGVYLDTGDPYHSVALCVLCLSVLLAKAKKNRENNQ